MKKTTVLLLAMLLSMMYSYAQSVPSATEVWKAAEQEAAAENKNVFIIFHASWCVWCHRMDSAMNEPALKPLFEKNYVIRHLTVDESDKFKHLENSGADAFRKKYGGEGQGIPYWLIFNSKGELLQDSRLEGADGKAGNNVGCPARPEEVAYFIEVLNKTSDLNQQQLEKIKARFLKNG